MTAQRVSEEELRQLRLALSPSEMAPHLVALIKKRDPARSISNRPICQVVDAKYDPGKACAILYRLDDHIVLGRLRWGDAGGSEDVLSAPGVALTLFPGDPALPNLRRALDPETLAADLSTVLTECREGLRIVQCKVNPVRYRPGRRCTLRIRLWLRDDQSQATVARTLFGKVYHDAAKATSVFAEMQPPQDIPTGSRSPHRPASCRRCPWSCSDRSRALRSSSSSAAPAPGRRSTTRAATLGSCRPRLLWRGFKGWV
jgi:hypothetical protein